MRNGFRPFLLCLLALALLSGCSRPVQKVSRTEFYFNTIITLTVYDAAWEPILDQAFDLCQAYEALLSRTAEGSDIWRINHAQGQPVEVDEKTAWLLTQAVQYAELTGGLLDPTVAGLVDLWNFTGDPAGPVPSQEALAECLSHVDYRALQIDGTTVTLSDPEAMVDLGFIAKGYIADQLKAFFLEQGVTSALIDLGGNILAVGSKPDGSPFSAGIRKPFGKPTETVAVLELTDRSLVSSGNYERYFEQDGERYHHILDAHTGWPCRTGLDSVTILSSSSTQGDALSTACFLLGSQEGIALIEALPEVEAMFIGSDGALQKTSGFPE